MSLRPSVPRAGRHKAPGTALPIIRPAEPRDLPGISRIAAEAFRGLRPASLGRRWVESCWRAFPRMRYWVAEGRPKGLFGYILWVEKGGFRREAVLELEQIAISSKLRGQGIGSRLVQESFRQLEGSLKGRGAQVKVVEVTTGTDQGAVGFYRRNLGAQVVARIPDLYHGDELLLLARRPGHPPR